MPSKYKPKPKTLNTHWRDAMKVALADTSIPRISAGLPAEEAREWFTEETVCRALIKLGYSKAKAYKLSRKLTGTPRERLIQAFNEQEGEK